MYTLHIIIYYLYTCSFSRLVIWSCFKKCASLPATKQLIVQHTQYLVTAIQKKNPSRRQQRTCKNQLIKEWTYKPAQAYNVIILQHNSFYVVHVYVFDCLQQLLCNTMCVCVRVCVWGGGHKVINNISICKINNTGQLTLQW